MIGSRARIWVVVLMALGVPVGSGRAQGWVTMPNGSLGYSTSYVTSGFFFCGKYLPPGACQSFGNSIILTNGASSMTMSFQGVSNSVVAPSSEGAGTIAALGGFTRSWSGSGPRLLPNTSIGPQEPLFFFTMSLALTAPMAQTSGFAIGWLNTNNTLDAFTPSGTTATFAVTPPPPPATYGALVFGDFTVPDSPVDPGTTQVWATVSVTPEPATLALLSTGLIGLGGIARRLRRRIANPYSA